MVNASECVENVPHRSAGIERFVERVYTIQQYLDEEEENLLRKQREIKQIGASLREALSKGNREI